MTDLVVVRRGLANRLDTIPNLEGRAYVPDSVTVLTACVVPGDPYIDYHGTFGPNRQAQILFDVMFVISKDVDFAWQQQLDELLSTGTTQNRSAVDAIEADETLAVTGLRCVVTHAHSWGVTDVGAAIYSVCRLAVQAYINRS